MASYSGGVGWRETMASVDGIIRHFLCSVTWSINGGDADAAVDGVNSPNIRAGMTA